MERILIIEDCTSLREVLQSFLESRGYVVDSYGSAEAARDVLGSQSYGCILADFKLPGKNGIEFLSEVRQACFDTPYLLMTAYSSVEIAVEALKQGANDFLAKPFEPELLVTTIQQVIKHRRIIDRDSAWHKRHDQRLITADSQMSSLMNQSNRAARVDSSVLIVGESGTGKELLARYIHNQSPRRDKPFIAVNCAALPEDLLDSEFFGHEAGAYTGATQRRIGVFEYASEGTVFLDEIGEMPRALQVKLLRVLQEREVKRVGSSDAIAINPRIITATACHIDEALKQSRLRDDFYYRVAVITFEIPPLRERPTDIELLARHFAEHFSNKTGREVPQFAAESWALIHKYSWPGNVRELENVVERAIILADDQIKPEHLGIISGVDFAALRASSITLQEIAQQAARQAEAEAIGHVLRQTAGNKSEAARVLGVSYKTLLNKVREYEI